MLSKFKIEESFWLNDDSVVKQDISKSIKEGEADSRREGESSPWNRIAAQGWINQARLLPALLGWRHEHSGLFAMTVVSFHTISGQNI